MYKNKLQELAQRSSLNLPSYACIREGPDHAPRFKAMVTFNEETFESPSFCSTLRQAEHAAAEVALNSLSKSGPTQTLASQALDETGACKNLLQEVAQRAGIRLPEYTTSTSGPGHLLLFMSTVELAGMKFKGDPARSKKQAEKNAAMVAWASLKELLSKGDGSSHSSESDASEEQLQVIIDRALVKLQQEGSQSHKISSSNSRIKSTRIASTSLQDSSCAQPQTVDQSAQISSSNPRVKTTTVISSSNPRIKITPIASTSPQGYSCALPQRGEQSPQILSSKPRVKITPIASTSPQGCSCAKPETVEQSPQTSYSQSHINNDSSPNPRIKITPSPNPRIKITPMPKARDQECSCAQSEGFKQDHQDSCSEAQASHNPRIRITPKANTSGQTCSQASGAESQVNHVFSPHPPRIARTPIPETSDKECSSACNQSPKQDDRNSHSQVKTASCNPRIRMTPIANTSDQPCSSEQPQHHKVHYVAAPTQASIHQQVNVIITRGPYSVAPQRRYLQGGSNEEWNAGGRVSTHDNVNAVIHMPVREQTVYLPITEGSSTFLPVVQPTRYGEGLLQEGAFPVIISENNTFNIVDVGGQDCTEAAR